MRTTIILLFLLLTSCAPLNQGTGNASAQFTALDVLPNGSASTMATTMVDTIANPRNKTVEHPLDKLLLGPDDLEGATIMRSGAVVSAIPSQRNQDIQQGTERRTRMLRLGNATISETIASFTTAEYAANEYALRVSSLNETRYPRLALGVFGNASVAYMTPSNQTALLALQSGYVIFLQTIGDEDPETEIVMYAQKALAKIE